ncbi:Adhesion G-Protein Coupled Receptor G2 [Manis pentadactyla]|nr:Adhesion G-Protein Coupled Receptor G2 [Manis pentadactyla]
MLSRMAVGAQPRQPVGRQAVALATRVVVVPPALGAWDSSRGGYRSTSSSASCAHGDPQLATLLHTCVHVLLLYLGYGRSPAAYQNACAPAVYPRGRSRPS